MDGQYLIPANSKKSLLIFGIFRQVDFMIFGIGSAISLILLFAIPGDSVSEMVIKLIPISIAGFLVMPIPFYHNILVFITEFINFFINRRVYLWKGWCIGRGEENK
jgi:hypothetical protein